MIFDWKINLEEFFSLWVEDSYLLVPRGFSNTLGVTGAKGFSKG